MRHCRDCKHYGRGRCWRFVAAYGQTRPIKKGPKKMCFEKKGIEDGK